MSAKPTVLVDLDDCVIDFVTYWLKWIEQTHGVKAEKKFITKWYLSECTPELKALGEEKICMAFDEPGFHLNAPAIPGAIHSLERMHKKYNLLFVTARHNPVSIKETFEWFKVHLPRIQHKQLIFSRQKDVFHAQAAIDDKVDHLQAYLAAPHMKGALVIGVEQPHNQEARALVPNWVTPDVQGWLDIEDMLEGL
jgi:5'(3')-deoxyribonucleotidase